MTIRSGTFRVAFLVFPGMTQLDFTGPHEVISRVPDVDIRLHWKEGAPVAAASRLAILPTATLSRVPDVDLLCIPGGPGQVALMSDDVVLDWVRETGRRARWVTSVCTGSLLLGAAGLLRGYRATCHWSALKELRLFGARTRGERVVVDRNRITGAGVTSGIDFALRLVAEVFGEERARAIQLQMEYDPAPPWPGEGSPRTARRTTLAQVHAATALLRRQRRETAVQAAGRLDRPR